MIRALRHRNYRLFFFGHGVSLIGTWMQALALPWLVYNRTNDPWLLGLVGFTGQILTFLLAPVAGVLADRWNRYRLVMLAQILSAVQAAILAALVMTDQIAVWHILVLSLAGGFIRAFEIPIRQSFIVDMIEDRRDLPNAIALNSFLVNGARLIGPALAGVVIDWMGEGACFLLNAVSFAAVIVALAAMRLPPRRAETPAGDALESLKEGWRYVTGSGPIRSALALLVVVSLMGVPYAVLMPIFAKDILHGDSYTMGFLMGAVGVGAVLGALVLATRKSLAGLARRIALAAALFGAGLVAFSFSEHLWLSLLLLVIAGFGMMMQMAGTNTFLQTIVDEDKRGRVMSFYTMAFMGMGPFGSLIAGALAGWDWLGAPGTVLVGGVACILAAAVFAVRLPHLSRQLLPVHAHMGVGNREPDREGPEP